VDLVCQSITLNWTIVINVWFRCYQSFHTVIWLNIDAQCQDAGRDDTDAMALFILPSSTKKLVYRETRRFIGLDQEDIWKPRKAGFCQIPTWHFLWNSWDMSILTGWNVLSLYHKWTIVFHLFWCQRLMGFYVISIYQNSVLKQHIWQVMATMFSDMLLVLQFFAPQWNWNNGKTSKHTSTIRWRCCRAADKYWTHQNHYAQKSAFPVPCKVALQEKSIKAYIRHLSEHIDILAVKTNHWTLIVHERHADYEADVTKLMRRQIFEGTKRTPWSDID